MPPSRPSDLTRVVFYCKKKEEKNNGNRSRCPEKIEAARRTVAGRGIFCPRKKEKEEQEKREEEQEKNGLEKQLDKNQHNRRINMCLDILQDLKQIGSTVYEIQTKLGRGSPGRGQQYIKQRVLRGTPCVELDRYLVFTKDPSKKIDDLIKEYQAQLIP